MRCGVAESIIWSSIIFNIEAWNSTPLYSMSRVACSNKRLWRAGKCSAIEDAGARA